MSIEMVLMSFSVLSFMVNASVWYRIGSIKSQVEQCENFKISPKCEERESNENF